METTSTEIPFSMSLLGALTGPELTYTHTGAAVILSILSTNPRYRQRALPGAAVILRDQAEVQSCWVRLYTLLSASGFWAQLNITEETLNLTIDSGQNPHGSDARIRQMK